MPQAQGSIDLMEAAKQLRAMLTMSDRCVRFETLVPVSAFNYCQAPQFLNTYLVMLHA